MAAVPGVLAGGWALEFPDLPNLPAAPGGRAGPDSACLLHSSGGYRHLAGALLPPVPAALRWDADVQPPAGLHRVAHHPGRPAWFRPFRLLSHCIRFAGERAEVFEGRKGGGPLRLVPFPLAKHLCPRCTSYSLTPSTQAFNNLENLVFGKGFQAKIFPESK